MEKTIALLAGDGIGPEIMTQAQRVLTVLAQQFGHQWNYQTALIGGAAYDQYQAHCPKETLAICAASDVILFGAVGGPVEEQHLPKWRACETESILRLRNHFQFNVNIRPVTLYPELAHLCPLRADIVAKGTDLLIFRELCGDLYFGEHREQQTATGRIAVDEAVYTEAQIISIAKAAFVAAQTRRQRLCSVDKANVLATSKLWRQVVTELSKDYPDVSLTHILVDNCAMQIILDPSQFDVMLTPNMFGDILSDLAAALPGSLGLLPSASLNRQGFGLYEPSGGSAPALAGQDKANPIAQLLSMALMLEQAFDLQKEAQCVRRAISQCLAQGIYTEDIAGGKPAVGMTVFTDAVIAAIA